MQPVTLAEVADELYGLTPAEFTAARDERARQVRADGQRDEATAIKKLARPTVGAWLVNQLARAASDQMDRLYQVGEDLAEAQRTLAGDKLRELSGARRQVISDLLPVATRLASTAGQTASPAVLAEVRATLEAALADAAAREAVRSGRLTKALAYAGLGEVDLTAALALPPETTKAPAARPKAASHGSAVGRADQALTARERARQEAEEARQEAGQTRQAAADSLAAAERELAGLTEQRQFLRRRIAHLERELSEARATEAELAASARQAQRAKDAAVKADRAAARAHDAAERKAR